MVQVYFTTDWARMVEVSFRNFLSEALLHLPLPALLRFDDDKRQRMALQVQVSRLQVSLATTDLQEHEYAALSSSADQRMHLLLCDSLPSHASVFADILTTHNLSAALFADIMHYVEANDQSWVICAG